MRAMTISYAVVIVDGNLQDEARTSYPDSIVIVRSGDVVSDIHAVEQGVARRPSAAGQRPAVVAARAARTPSAAGPERSTRRVVAAGELQPVSEPTPPPAATTVAPTPPPVAPTPTPPAPTPPPAVVATVTKPPPEVRAPIADRRSAPKANSVHDEVYFALGSAQLDARAASIAKIVRWLSASSDVQVTIEGHADPTGTHEGNQLLAQKRAEWLRDQLVAGGIDQSRLDVISYGDTRLRYGRADRRNRRAAVVVK